MKINKWISVTLTILLTLIVLAGVAGVSFRMGAMQNTVFAGNDERMAQHFQAFGHMQGFNNERAIQPGENQRMMRGFDHGGFGRGYNSFFSPLFGLIKLAVLGALLWLGFKFVKNSGWRITRETAQPAPAASETPSVEVEEKKESE
ncbi:MAG: hypothetical protein HY863_01050 [Chloroflexi bacterium]|nr:hypothetical protein [Chloroflexota bacterium]